jgi:hypothetical protein
MKKGLGTLLISLTLILILGVPSAATAPTEVSGQMVAAAPVIPPLPEQESHGDNCVITMRFWHAWDGSFRGEDTADVRIVEHGSCDQSGPNKHRENIKWRGTFTGELCLGGTWEDSACIGGELYSGSFDFVGQWQVTPAPEPTFTGNFVILQGYDGFANLHGVLEFWGRVGTVDGWGKYAGQVHVDPS